MTAPAIVPEVVVPAESLTVTPPPAAMLSQAEATAQFIEKYRTQQASEAAGGEREPETVVPAVDAPEVPVVPEGEKPVAPEGEKPAEVEGEKPPESQFRNADGTFAKAIKAKFGETDFEVPEGLLIPLKRGDTIEYKPLAEIQKEGMLYNDYNKSKQEVAEERRTGRVEIAAAKAEAEVWKGITKELLERPELALKYRNDPVTANLWADAAEGRLATARTDAVTKTQQDFAADNAVTQVRSWAEAMAGEFPGVDPAQVLQEYGDFLYQHGEAVKAGRAPDDPTAVSMDRLRSHFQRHHARVTQVTSPLKAELDDLKKQLADLKAEKATAAKNAATQHAVTRAKAPGVIAGAGGVTVGSTGAVTGPGGKPLAMNDAHKEFLKRYQ